MTLDSIETDPAPFMDHPLFTASVDQDGTTVRARGRLNHISADLLRGTVEALWRRGHSLITLEIGDLSTPDASADAVLSTLIAELEATGIRLTLHGRRLPSRPRTRTVATQERLGVRPGRG